METTPIGNTTSTFAPTGSQVKSKNQLDFETFLRLLTVQLSTQNPLEPMNDRDFFAQMAQLGTVQGMDELNKTSEMTQASNLLGKEVLALRPMTEEGSGGENGFVTGRVERVTVRNGETILGVREEGAEGIVEVKLANVREVRA